MLTDESMEPMQQGSGNHVGVFIGQDILANQFIVKLVGKSASSYLGRRYPGA